MYDNINDNVSDKYENVYSLKESLVGQTNLKIGHLDVNGWTEANKQLRIEIVNNMHCDVIGLSETHLKDGVEI